MSVSNDNKRPVDIVMDADGCWRALYADGSLGLALSQPVSVRVWKQPASGYAQAPVDNVDSRLRSQTYELKKNCTAFSAVRG